MSQEKLLPLLRYFHALAQCGSFTRAAEQLHVSQSTVSIQIKKLESQLGVELLQRASKHRFQLTAKGQQLAAQCARSLGELDATLQSLSQQSPYEGELTLATSIGFGVEVIIPVLQRLHQRYPDLLIHLKETGGNKDFYADQIDLATNFDKPDPAYHNVLLCQVNKTMVASEHYLTQYGTPSNLADCNRHRLLLQRKGFKDWRCLFAEQQLEMAPRQLQLFDNNISKLRAAELGLGIAILPNYVVNQARGAGLREILPGSTASLREDNYLVCEKRRMQDPKIKLVMNAIVDAARQEKG